MWSVAVPDAVPIYGPPSLTSHQEELARTVCGEVRFCVYIVGRIDYSAPFVVLSTFIVPDRTPRMIYNRQLSHHASIFPQSKVSFVYDSDICTSSSPVVGGAAGVDVEAAAAAGGGGTSFGCIVWRYTSIGAPSRMRKSTVVSGPSCTPAGPTTPMEVLLIVSSLSCWSVSRRACNPWRISSSKPPKQQTNTYIRVYYKVMMQKKGTYSLQRTRSVSRGRSWRSGCVHRSRRRSTRTRCRSGRTRTGVGRYGQVRRQESRRRRGGGRIPAYSPGPLIRRVSSVAGIERRGERVSLGEDALSAMADTRRLTGIARLNTILDPMACWRIKLLHGSSKKEGTREESGSLPGRQGRW